MSDDQQHYLSNSAIKKTANSLISTASNAEMKTLKLIDNKAYRIKLTSMYYDFSMTYPGLFNVIIEDPEKFPMKRLDEMLELKKKIQSKSISYEKASTKVGKQYYDEFVKKHVSEDKETNNEENKDVDVDGDEQE